MSTTTRLTLLLLAGGLVVALHDAPEARSPAARGDDAQSTELQPLTLSPVEVPIDDRSDASVAASASRTWREDQVRVAPAHGARLDAIARDWDVSVVRDVGASGFGVLGVPPGQSALQFAATLRSDGSIDAVGANAVIEGVGRPRKKAEPTSTTTTTSADSTEASAVEPARANPLQWHLDAVGAPYAGDADLSGVVVAVIDSGVAYEDYAIKRGQTYVQAPSLADVEIVAPWDFVAGDEHANDEHQHGTHIASTIASKGSVEGVAPGVALMPLRVLDANNQGTEHDLVEAIHYAVDNGADIINLSLSFSEEYAPSPALVDALTAAYDGRVVVIAAAGNEAAGYVSFPAASPLAIAVAASDRAEARADAPVAAGYANRAPRVDIAAPGGEMDADLDGDGVVDGILAETIGFQDPETTGLWLYAGSSQAAAIVSGVAAYLVAEGVPFEETQAAMQLGAYRLHGDSFYGEGLGAGRVRVDRSLAVYANDVPQVEDPHAFQVGLLPFLARNGDGTVTPTAQLTVVTRAGRPPPNSREVWVRLSGADSGSLSCMTGPAGRCTVQGQPVALDGLDAHAAWAFSVESVIRSGVAHRPGAALFASDAFEIVLAALDDSDEARGRLVGWHWQRGVDDELGGVAAAYAVVNAGTGLSSSPLGIVFRPAVAQDYGTTTDTTLDIDGTGLSSSPLGLHSVRLLDLTGSGLSSSPLGLATLKLAVFSGSGLSSSPLGFSPSQLYSGTAPVYDSEWLDFDGDAVLLGSGGVAELVLDPASELGLWLDGGGGVDGSGYPAATLLAGTGVVDVSAEAATLYPSGDGSAPLE